MKTENVSFKHKGKTISGQIAWPESLQEAIHSLEPAEVWEAFKIGYRDMCRRRILGLTRPPRRFVRIDLSLLTPEEQHALLTWKANAETFQNQQSPPVEKSAPPEPTPTDPTDFDEMPAEAQASTSPHVDTFEEDFAKYLASRSS